MVFSGYRLVKKSVIFLSIVLLFIFVILITRLNGEKSNLKKSVYMQNELNNEVKFELISSQYEDNTWLFTFLLQNKSSYEIAYGDFFIVEKLIRTKWYEVFQSNEWFDILHELKANVDEEVLIPIADFSFFDKGTYRVIKEITFSGDTFHQNSFVAAEFEMY